ncbi:hypothetical protein X801_02289 [Opisthorchis viverrini]|uniref:Uncharacterized protein n=1 Tax=Opisthorchis viverrini TaxID=6198 RepID=A0A1S8X4Z9_OPIVI|nr:hypothetical protein X801_02289 [Opisthorchis viverrini]
MGIPMKNVWLLRDSDLRASLVDHANICGPLNFRWRKRERHDNFTHVLCSQPTESNAEIVVVSPDVQLDTRSGNCVYVRRHNRLRGYRRNQFTNELSGLCQMVSRWNLGTNSHHLSIHKANDGKTSESKSLDDDVTSIRLNIKGSPCKNRNGVC